MGIKEKVRCICSALPPLLGPLYVGSGSFHKGEEVSFQSNVSSFHHWVPVFRQSIVDDGSL
jgi:hypothetical protein